MFYIPCRLPMPNKKQGLFHTNLCTFNYMQLLEPEVYSPAPEAPAHMQVYPQYIHPAVSSTKKIFQSIYHVYKYVPVTYCLSQYVSFYISMESDCTRSTSDRILILTSSYLSLFYPRK